MGWVQNVWVQADAAHRMNPEDIMRLNAVNKDGKTVPLSSFVSAQWTNAPIQIVRYNSYDSVRIGGSASPGYSTGQALDPLETLVAKLPGGAGHAWADLPFKKKRAGHHEPEESRGGRA